MGHYKLENGISMGENRTLHFAIELPDKIVVEGDTGAGLELSVTELTAQSLNDRKKELDGAKKKYEAADKKYKEEKGKLDKAWDKKKEEIEGDEWLEQYARTKLDEAREQVPEAALFDQLNNARGKKLLRLANQLAQLLDVDNPTDLDEMSRKLEEKVQEKALELAEANRGTEIEKERREYDNRVHAAWEDLVVNAMDAYEAADFDYKVYTKAAQQLEKKLNELAQQLVLAEHQGEVDRLTADHARKEKEYKAALKKLHTLAFKRNNARDSLTAANKEFESRKSEIMELWDAREEHMNGDEYLKERAAVNAKTIRATLPEAKLFKQLDDLEGHQLLRTANKLANMLNVDNPTDIDAIEKKLEERIQTRAMHIAELSRGAEIRAEKVKYLDLVETQRKELLEKPKKEYEKLKSEVAKLAKNVKSQRTDVNDAAELLEKASERLVTKSWEVFDQMEDDEAATKYKKRMVAMIEDKAKEQKQMLANKKRRGKEQSGA